MANDKGKEHAKNGQALLGPRLTELLVAAEEALRDGRDPFDTAFLAEHAVTYGECMGLSEALAFAIESLLALLRQPSAFVSVVLADGIRQPSASVRTAD